MNFVKASDRALLVTQIASNAGVHELRRRLQHWDGVTSQSPAYTSLLVRFDPRHVTHEVLEERIAAVPLETTEFAVERVVEIPVTYNGPDLQHVAERHALTIDQVVEAHTATLYHAYFAGFVPGFVYLGDVPAAIATPRRATPRREVPAGSVGIAGTQTGVYPRCTPGGWNLIGLTSAAMFDAANGRALVEPGNKVRFIPV